MLLFSGVFFPWWRWVGVRGFNTSRALHSRDLKAARGIVALT